MNLVCSERGATITETAFLLPALILFLMVIIEGGRALSVWMTLTHSTRETVRFMVAGQQENAAESACSTGNSINWTCVQNSLTSTAQSYEQALVGSMLDTGSLVVTPAYATDAVGTVASVTITATYTVHTQTPLLQKLVPSFPIYTTATMRAEL